MEQYRTEDTPQEKIIQEQKMRIKELEHMISFLEKERRDRCRGIKLHHRISFSVSFPGVGLKSNGNMTKHSQQIHHRLINCES